MARICVDITNAVSAIEKVILRYRSPGDNKQFEPSDELKKKIKSYAVNEIESRLNSAPFKLEISIIAEFIIEKLINENHLVKGC